MAMTYLESVSNTLAADDQGLIKRAKEKFGPELGLDDVKITSYWLYHFNQLLPASHYNRVLLFRPLPPNRCFDCVQVIDKSGKICWDLFSEGLLEAKGAHIGIVLAGYRVQAENVQVKWIEKDQKEEDIDLFEGFEEIIGEGLDE